MAKKRKKKENYNLPNIYYLCYYCSWICYCSLIFFNCEFLLYKNHKQISNFFISLKIDLFDNLVLILHTGKNVELALQLI